MEHIREESDHIALYGTYGTNSLEVVRGKNIAGVTLPLGMSVPAGRCIPML